MFGEWKADIVYRPEYIGYAVYMSRRVPAGQEFISKDGTKILMEEGQYVASDKDYTFAILDQEQVQKLADAFADKGIHTVNDHKNAGILEATHKHLEDMRSIVFKNKIKE